MTDLYGNPEQTETPTTRTLADRKDKRAASDSHFKLGTKVYPNLTRGATAKHLRDVAEVIEESKAKRFRFEFTIEEVKT